MSLSENWQTEFKSFIPHAAFLKNRSVAVLLPCFNEEAAIASVIQSFHLNLPGARVYVYDNNSTDGTVKEAEKTGAVVRHERTRGKGNVVRRMFADIDADIYVLADGDGTYDASACTMLIDRLISDNLDMVIGARDGGSEDAYRQGHKTGNRVFNRIVRHLFGSGFNDIFSGYRIFSRRFVKSFPAESSGFEIETELSIHALDLKIATAEVSVPYGSRGTDSTSKLRTYRDGARILWTILLMYRSVQPYRFFSALCLALMIISAGLGTPIVFEYLQTGLVPRMPTAILSASIMQLGFLSLACGLILEAISSSRREIKRLRYLELPSVASSRVHSAERRAAPR